MAPRVMMAALVWLLASDVTSALADEIFQFWPGKGADRVPGVQLTHEHPCGQIALARVSKLPTGADGPLIAEEVVELDRRGKVLRRWPMPVDFTPHAVRGSALLAVLARKGIWIRPDGSFSRAKTIPAASDRPIDCDLNAVFGASAYNECAVFTDIASHRKRTLGFQGVCS